jgi:hypothetical protein
VKAAMLGYSESNRLPILYRLSERLYVLRNQVFHGASTKGSRLNRRTLQFASGVMMDLLPALLGVLIESGAGQDWGEICFPPVED